MCGWCKNVEHEKLSVCQLLILILIYDAYLIFFLLFFPPLSLFNRIRQVELVIEPGQSLGLMIRGGIEYGLGIYVTGVDKDSVADRAGLMVSLAKSSLFFFVAMKECSCHLD